MQPAHPQPPGTAGASFPQQPQQHYPHQGLNGGWQSDKDYQERRKMIAKIVHLLQQRKPNAPQEWLKKLPQMAKRLEESLYRSARSFNEYNDANTLKQRLQQLAVNIGMKTKKLQQQQAVQGQQAQPLAAQPFGPLVKPQTTQQPLAPIQAAPVANGQRMVNMAEINPIMAQPTQPQLGPIPAPPAAPVQQIQYANSMVAASVPAQNGSALVGSSATDAAGRQIANRQQVLRHQQQRLLLLRHAAKCQHEDNCCPVTPHCAGMKRLWKHIAECKNQKCLVPHCVSSRYVLSHYHRCKDVRCPVCGPVREAIHRSHEKQKQMQALKQRPRQLIAGTTEERGAAVPVVSHLSHSGSVGEPPNKRPKTSTGVLTAPSFQVQQRPLQQPSGEIPGLPVQPLPGRQLTALPQQQGGTPVVASVAGIAFSNGQVIMPKHSGPKPQEDHTLINCFSVAQIETHIESLSNGLQLPPLKLKTKCLEVLRVLQLHQHAWVFNTPVDPMELGLPDYYEVVKQPMDLGTIKKKLENGVYTKLEEFEDNVHLTFDNAMLYNPEGSVVYNMASEMKEKFTRDYAALIKQLHEEEDIKRKNGEACLLCGCEKLLFEPPVFYCNGLNCPSKRIRRNSYYFIGGNNQYHWCHLCFQEIRDNSTIDLGDMSIKKESLTKKKNDEVHEESWVQCDRCERWVHQICALFNTRQNKDQRSEYCCPRCTIDERRKKGKLEAQSTTPMAEDLPRTKLSEYLENHVRDKVNEFLEQKSIDKCEKENIPIEEARKQLQMGGAITIRQVTSMDRKLEVRERMKNRYAFKNYPDEFNFRCKCIVVFQNLDGVDVMLFGLYVYEHDERNPSPNKRTVYVSYLDSVHYMRPRQMRTFIYHEILVSYLDYVRRRGFATAHIWACPPLKGDDYILYAKPEDQKTPRDDRLRQWYLDMLVDCQRRGIVGTVTNMYDLYFSDPKNDASVVPYMDGDYFPAEAENIIKDIEEGKTGRRGSSQVKKKDSKAKQKKKSGRGGTRSTGLDEEALKASGILPVGSDQKSLEEGGRDYVMTKLGETIQPMKESFLVAFLAWEGAREEDMVVPKDIQELRERNNITWKLERGERDCTEKIELGGGPAESVGDVIANGDTLADTDGQDDTKDEIDSSDGMEVDKQIEAPSCNNADSGPPMPTPANHDVTENSATVEDGQTVSEPAHTCAEDSVGDALRPTEVNGVGPAPMNGVKKEEAADDNQNAQVATADAPTSCAAPGAATAEEVTSCSAPVAATAEEATSCAAPGAATAEETKAAGGASEHDPDVVCSETSTTSKINSVNMSIRVGKFAAMAARKRDRDTISNEIGDSKSKEIDKKDVEKSDEKASTTLTVKDSKGRVVKVLDDDEEELDCEFLNNRQAFLNLCQGNHYQFDQVRRAKHTSMMVLWHLHNRDAPKFVQQCATCSREILAGLRYHCPTCADFDQCQECVGNPKVQRHIHPLKPTPVSNGQATDLTEAQRKERQRSIQLHMTLLQHAATCNSVKCPSANCTKMKGLLKHGAQCQVKATGGCNVCKRIWALLQIHARQCKLKSCLVPNCMAIRERVRQLKKQQQAMDDRRRVEMNRAYGGGGKR
jgi:E1A/CREB-binding protein